MIQPIKPSEVVKEVNIPDFIIEAVNKLIKEKWDGSEAKIYQDDILEIVAVYQKDPDANDGRPTREEVFKNHWLDFEDLYRKQGWKVVYDKPAYCETYKAYFVFSKKK